ncbi:hypothetical protein BJX76DRAFT_362766, partial [Aspergillus varians]
MPLMADDGEYDGASGPSSSMDAEGRGLGLAFIPQRPRRHSTSPPSSQKIVTDSAPRSISPDPTLERDENGFSRSRRPSLLRFVDSPTAVPLQFRPPPTSPRLQRSPPIGSPTAASPSSPSQGRRSRPNSTEFKTSREFRPLLLVERHGARKMEGQFDEPLPSLPSSKSGSVEDLTALVPDEKAWEAPELNREVHETQQRTEEHYGQQDVLGSQQNTPTRATFGLPRHLSRKEELGYEFHSPSELLRSDPDLPPSPTMGTLPSVEGSAVGIKEDDDLENLPALPDSRPSTPEDKAIPVSEAQQTTPTQEKSLPTTDIPDVYSGPGFTGAVDTAMVASAPDTYPFPDAELLAKSQAYDAEDDDAIRTVIGDDTPNLADLTPPTSPIRDRGHPAAPWEFASVVGAATDANRGLSRENHAPPGYFPVTTPYENEKPPESIADTTEDEFFDAMSRDEVADEEAWEMDFPTGRSEPAMDVEKPFVAREVSEDIGAGQDRELAPENQPEHQPEHEPMPELEPEAVKTEEPSITEKKPTESGPETVERGIGEEPIELQPEGQNQPSSSKSLDINDQGGEKQSLEKPASELVSVTPLEDEKSENVLTSEAQAPRDLGPEQIRPEEAPALEKANFSEQVVPSDRGLPDDVQDSKPFEEAQVVSIPEPVVPSEEAIALPEQAPIADPDQPVEERRSLPTLDVPAPEETETLPTEEPSATEQLDTLEKEPVKEEATREIIPENTRSSKALEPEPTQPQEPEETPEDAGLSKKAKKKKKAAAKAAAAAAIAAAVADAKLPAEESAPVEEVSARTEEVSAPMEEASAPMEEASAPMEEASAPMEEASAPMEEASALVEEVSAQTGAPSIRLHDTEDASQDQAMPASPSLNQTQDNTIESAPRLHDTVEDFQDSTAGEELGGLETDGAATVQDNPVEEETSPALESPTEWELVEPVTPPEQSTVEPEPEQVQIPEPQPDDKEPTAQESSEPDILLSVTNQEAAESSAHDNIEPPAQSETLPESKEQKEEDKSAQPEAEIPLSRKASKKNKKNKRKSAAEALPEPEAVDVAQSEPEASEKPVPEVEADLALSGEKSKLTELEAMSGDGNEILTGTVKNEEPVEPLPSAVDDSQPVLSEEIEPDVQAIAGDEGTKIQEQDDISGKDKNISSEAVAPDIVDTMDSSQPVTLPENKEEVVPEEPAGGQTKKKSKKKNRISVNLSKPQPESEPEAKPEDVAAPLETSGQVPPLDDSEQQHDAGTEQESRDTQSVDPVSEKVDDEPSQPVEIPEANDSEPHVSEQPTVEPEAGEQSSTGKKSKKKKKNKQSVSSAPKESVPLDVVEPFEASETQTPITEAAPDVPIEAPAISEEPSKTPAEEPSEMSRDVEPLAESGDVAIPDDQAASEALAMTTAQKRKAKKDKKKKRQSLAQDDSEAQHSEPAAEKELTDVPAHDDTQEPEIAEAEVENAEAVTPVAEQLGQETREQTRGHADEPVVENVSEQLGDESAATEQTVLTDEPPTIEATEA